jgi:hypothetical protein
MEDERSLKRNRQVMRTTGIVPALHDTPLRDREGVTVGELEDLLADAATNRPAWLYGVPVTAAASAPASVRH